MTTADSFEVLYGDPVFKVTFQAFAEGLDGNGVLDAGDLKVTAGSNSNALDVAATSRGLWYNGSLHTYGGGTNVLTLSSNTSGNPRWDLIYFDTSSDSPGKREGTAATKPDLPTLQSGEFPLAAVYVADGQSDVTDSEIKNYRVHGSEAAETYLDDSPGLYSNPDVENALTSELQDAAQLGAYPLASGDLASDSAGKDEVNVPEVVVDAPNGHIPTALLADTESAELPVPVPDGETLKVYRWGVYKISDGTAPTGLQVQLLDGSDTVQASANTTNNENTSSPVASLSNSSGSLSIYKLRADNATGNDYLTDGVGAVFGYVIE